MFLSDGNPPPILFIAVEVQILFVLVSGIAVYFTRRVARASLRTFCCHLFFLCALPLLVANCLIIGLWTLLLPGWLPAAIAFAVLGCAWIALIVFAKRPAIDWPALINSGGSSFRLNLRRSETAEHGRPGDEGTQCVESQKPAGAPPASRPTDDSDSAGARKGGVQG